MAVPSKTKLGSADVLAVVAPTAVAAINVDGSTMNKAFQFPMNRNKKPYPDETDLVSGSESLAQLQRNHRYVLIYFADEFGMIGPDTLALTSERIKQAHPAQADSSYFSGRSFVLFGHHAHLPPILNSRRGVVPDTEPGEEGEPQRN